MDDKFEVLAGIFRDLSFIRVGFVFGSINSGFVHPGSDIDLAVAADQPLDSAQKIALIERVAAEFGRPVDVIDLLSDGGPVLKQAILNGRRIYMDDSHVYARVLNRMTAHEADIMPYYNRTLAQRRRRWIGV